MPLTLYLPPTVLEMGLPEGSSHSIDVIGGTANVTQLKLTSPPLPALLWVGETETSGGPVGEAFKHHSMLKSTESVYARTYVHT